MSYFMVGIAVRTVDGDSYDERFTASSEDDLYKDIQNYVNRMGRNFQEIESFSPVHVVMFDKPFLVDRIQRPRFKNIKRYAPTSVDGADDNWI